MQGRVRGVIGITDRHTPDVNTRGTVDVYIARMFIAGAHRELLPTWARFIQGVIECDVLTPNAARDNVVANEAQAEVRRVIGERILAWLTAMSKERPARFTDIMRWHAYHVLAMAVQDEHEAFFRAVADIVPLESDQGPLSMKAYLETSAVLDDGKRTVFYLTERGSATQYYVLCAARGLHVFNASENFAERFLERYAATWPERIQLTRLDVTASQHIFTDIKAADPDREKFRELEETYAALFSNVRVLAEAKVSRFLPTNLPAVLTETRDQKARREMESLSANVALPGAIRDMMKGFLKDKRDPLTLHVNANNPTIARLAARGDFRGEHLPRQNPPLPGRNAIIRARIRDSRAGTASSAPESAAPALGPPLRRPGRATERGPPASVRRSEPRARDTLPSSAGSGATPEGGSRSSPR